MKRFCYGVYRALVVNVADPTATGRIKVSCPDISGSGISGWAHPCVPVGGLGVPAPGSLVWVACEQGDPDQLVWLGVFGFTPAAQVASGVTAVTGDVAAQSSVRGNPT